MSFSGIPAFFLVVPLETGTSLNQCSSFPPLHSCEHLSRIFWGEALKQTFSPLRTTKRTEEQNISSATFDLSFLLGEDFCLQNFLPSNQKFDQQNPQKGALLGEHLLWITSGSPHNQPGLSRYPWWTSEILHPCFSIRNIRRNQQDAMSALKMEGFLFSCWFAAAALESMAGALVLVLHSSPPPFHLLVWPQNKRLAGWCFFCIKVYFNFQDYFYLGSCEPSRSKQIFLFRHTRIRLISNVTAHIFFLFQESTLKSEPLSWMERKSSFRYGECDRWIITTIIKFTYLALHMLYRTINMKEA